MAKDDDSLYSGGYGKPPRHTRFKPGQSGNPKGRPKKVQTLTDAFAKQARKLVPVQTNGKTRKMTMLEIVVTRHFGQAAKGDHKSAGLVFSALRPSEINQDSNLPELLQEFREKNARDIAAEKKRNGSMDDDGSSGDDE